MLHGIALVRLSREDLVVIVGIWRRRSAIVFQLGQAFRGVDLVGIAKDVVAREVVYDTAKLGVTEGIAHGCD